MPPTRGQKIFINKAKHLDISQPMKQHSKLYFHSIKQISSKEGTLKLLFQQLSQITCKDKKPALQQ